MVPLHRIGGICASLDCSSATCALLVLPKSLWRYNDIIIGLVIMADFFNIFSLEHMVHIIKCSLEDVAHLWPETGILICLRHLFTSKKCKSDDTSL